VAKSTISMVIFNSFLYVYQRVHPNFSGPWSRHLISHPFSRLPSKGCRLCLHPECHRLLRGTGVPVWCGSSVSWAAKSAGFNEKMLQFLPFTRYESVSRPIYGQLQPP
jgi:hypothetical protein